MPGRDVRLRSVWLPILHMIQTITGLGGDLEVRLANRLRFYTVTVSRNSSFAPLKPRNRSLVMPKLRFASPNNRAIEVGEDNNE